MVVSTPNTTTPNIPPASALLFANRFQLLGELSHDEEATKPDSKFQAQGVYKPPHMRTPSESVASTGSDPMVSYTSTVGPTHGPSSDRERNLGTSRPRTPHIGSTPGSTMLGFGEMKKKLHEELLNARKVMEEMETMEKEFLEEEARFEKQLQVVRSAGLTDEEIREIMGWNSAKFPPKPPSGELLDVNNVGLQLARINLGSEQELERLARAHEEKPVQQTKEDLVNKTPIPGGPIYSSANHLKGIHQTGKYGHSTPWATPANNVHYDTSIRQAAGRNDQPQAYPEGMGHHGSIPSGTFQVPGQIYQATPGMRFNSSVDSVPPRFRQPPVYYQPALLHYQNAVHNRPRDTVPADNPVSWPPVPSQPQNPTPTHTFRPTSIPPPPRPYFYEVDLVFDFEGVALSSNCNRDIFVKTYWKMNGFSPSQAAWAAWASVVEKVKRVQQCEYQQAMERETRERCGAGSRLPKWCSSVIEDLPGSELSYSSSSSDASTKVASSRNSEAGDEGSMIVNVVGSNGKRESGVPRVQKPWKDVTDKTWVFGEPPRPDDPEQYMTRIVEKVGWQVHDPRPE